MCNRGRDSVSQQVFPAAKCKISRLNDVSTSNEIGHEFVYQLIGVTGIIHIVMASRAIYGDIPIAHITLGLVRAAPS